MLGNVAPPIAAVPLWQTARRLNPHHAAAALNRALVMETRNEKGAWNAFQDALRAVENPQRTSASDLALTWVPGRVMRRIGQRILWGPAQGDYLTRVNDRRRQDALALLARRWFERCCAAQEWERAHASWEAWERTAGDTVQVRWARVQLDWSSGEAAEGIARMTPLIEGGVFLSPLHTARWAERLLEHGAFDLAAGCLQWARRWIPESAQVWALQGRLDLARGDSASARRCWERALSLNPQDVGVVLALSGLDLGKDSARVQAKSVRLLVDAPKVLGLGKEAALVCRLQGAAGTWAIHALPPAGWGIVAEPRVGLPDGQYRCDFTIRACRPDRIRGEPWPITLVAMSDQEYTTAQVRIEVADQEPGQVLVVCTEDHEIHEERGKMTTDQLRQLLVAKSRFASSHFRPWTHMVEVGSSLAMPGWSEQYGPGWRELERAVRDHLAEEVAGGNDIQPHLHAFNLPAGRDFPYQVSRDAWRPNYTFLLTAEERRGDFARAFPPPNWGIGQDRLAAVSDAAARLEALGRLGDPDYRPLLWRSGQLEYGTDPADRAWSAVALLRAGLFADSDLPRPRSQAEGQGREAFFADFERPFESQPGGVLLQLPIWGNLEGDFRINSNLVRSAVRATTERLRNRDGAITPGIHLFTLLTHDKFINARRGGDEFRLDLDYGDWKTLRAHLAEWRQQGAKFVTGREGTGALLEDGAWRPVPVLSDETFIAHTARVRYTLRLLGRGIPVSEDCAQHLLVTIPPSLRASLVDVRVCQAGRELVVERTGADSFWTVVTDGESPIRCFLDLTEPAGPDAASMQRVADGTWQLVIGAPEQFLRSHLLIPWALLGLTAAAVEVADDEGHPVAAAVEEDGVAITLPPFSRDGRGAVQAQSLVLQCER